MFSFHSLISFRFFYSLSFLFRSLSCIRFTIHCFLLIAKHRSSSIRLPIDTILGKILLKFSQKPKLKRPRKRQEFYYINKSKYESILFQKTLRTEKNNDSEREVKRKRQRSCEKITKQSNRMFSNISRLAFPVFLSQKMLLLKSFLHTFFFLLLSFALIFILRDTHTYTTTILENFIR